MIILLGTFWTLNEINNAQWDKVMNGIIIIFGSIILIIAIYRFLLRRQIKEPEEVDIFQSPTESERQPEKKNENATLTGPDESKKQPDMKDLLRTLEKLKKKGGLPDRKEVMEVKRLLKTPEELKAEAEDRARIKRNRVNQQLKFEQAMSNQAKRIKHERGNAQNKLKQNYSRGKLSRADAWKVVHGNISTCKRCGVVRLENMDWHHLDPLTKVATPSYFTKKVDPEGPFKTAIQERDYNNAKAEVDKCILLCKNCHVRAKEHRH